MLISVTGTLSQLFT